MKFKILTCKSCCVSAKLLRDKMEELTNLDIFVTQDASKVRGPFIRYGNSDAVKGTDSNYNNANFIRLASNKAAFATLMQKHKIYSPVYYNKEKPNKFPVIIRKTLTGSGGRGIVVCSNKESFDNNWDDSYVWTPFIQTQFELRLHILGGRVVKIFKKIPTNKNEVNLPIRNLDKGYHYQVREIEKYPKIQESINKIHPVLGGAFYSLDIGWDAINKKYFIFEANSGSGLNDNTAELYANFLVHELNNA